MSNTRKILSVVLAIIMAVSMFAVAANAAYESEEDVAAAKYTQTWALGDPVENADGTWSVDVYLTTNYETGTIEFVLTNTDNTVAEIQSATVGAAIPESYNATAHANSTSKGKVTIYADTSGTGSIEAEPIDGVIATVVYSYSGSGTAEIAIDNNPKTAANPTGTLIATRMSDKNVVTGDFITGQNVLSVGESVIIGGAAMEPADLALTDVGVANGVIIDTHKTFGSAYAGVVYGVTATTFKTKANITNNVAASNGGSLVVKSSTGQTTASGNFGTGSTIEVLNADGSSTGKIYVFVVFGDVDGNGLINASDAQTTLSVISDASIAPNNSVKRMAANAQLLNNATMMHTVNANDAQAILKHVTGTKIDQVAYAAKQNGYNNFYQ